VSQAGVPVLPTETQRWRAAWKAQSNTISGIFFREAEMRHGHSFALSYLAYGIEPLIIVATIGALFSALSRTPAYGSSLLLFIGTGVFPIYLFIHTSLRIRQPLGAGLHRHRFPIEQPLDHIIVHAVLHVIACALIVVLFFAGLHYIGGIEAAIPYDPLMAIEALGGVLLLGLSMGIFNSVVARFLPMWDMLWPAVARASLHFSGPYFVAAYLPPDKRWYFGFNPVMHGVNWFRHAFYPFYPNQLTDPTYLLLVAIGMITLGLMLEAATRRHLQERE